ncbi:hypothetical protein DUNSADRAFT_16144 [Dunaliella salina]|uniref:Encoded protein n=1 Tax=Dunaliella salina TaxID=3046 RepID=A0ABQ7H195_DUNSA|nr:hypothetical protein DUNSADRAFT_16144 [Dunaliella salina]|eukprot:KAF5840629.1 hypothetical protein DUNSADRAFT_16144 [Dunaliella salina]
MVVHNSAVLLQDCCHRMEDGTLGKLSLCVWNQSCPGQFFTLPNSICKYFLSSLKYRCSMQLVSQVTSGRCRVDKKLIRHVEG